tara:strand:+ start:108 stop:602 length:495 start_codon:yes stop_codon:yes gene_type:complete
MKKLSKILTLMIIVLTVGVSCDDSTNDVTTSLNFVEVKIPDSYQALPSGRTASEDVDDEIIDIKVQTVDGKEIIGKVHLVMTNDQTLSYFAVTENILEETGLTTEYWIEAMNASSNGRIVKTHGCFSDCNDDYEKGEGRGLCKAECWLDIALKVAPIVIAVIAL